MLLKIEDLKINYMTDKGGLEVVRGLDLGIEKKECVGLVGESGCGKTTVGLSITKLLPEHNASISAGRILFEGRDVLALVPEELRRIRGKRISYVFQDPFSSLNPVFTIHEQLKEALSRPLQAKGGTLPETEKPDKAIFEILNNVGLTKIAGNKKIYPHELSGGMQQRVMIAMAIASRPDLLILDEPTTALDVTTQRQILDLIVELKDKMALSILFISHDLNIIFRLADKIAVMYAGRIVEMGHKKDVALQPRHPYTIGLIESIPSLEHRKKRFNAIEGRAPLFSDLPQGCKFHPRCKFRIDRCMEKEPELEEITSGHASRCIRSKELLADGVNKSK